MKLLLLLTAFAVLFFPNVARADLLPTELVIEALVDGPSMFHVRADGVFWENGDNGKPGKHAGHDEPTYINGAAWTPRWGKSRELRGRDKTEMNRINLGSIDLEFELIAVTQHRGETGIEQRSEIATKVDRNDFVITIPDPEPGSRWYKFVVRKKKK